MTRYMHVLKLILKQENVTALCATHSSSQIHLEIGVAICLYPKEK